ncbi:MAG: hypothetical protein CM15mP62_05490 [Rhodospirillaceae bacterium]|nr:MAG: hypothetical protein CM15mP62_05490 [Rhodospirillaceae bacterium]
MYKKMENTIVDKIIEFWFADASNSPENAFSRKPFWYEGGKIIDQKYRKRSFGKSEALVMESCLIGLILHVAH